MELPIGLKNSIEAGNCILFIGAGINSHIKNKAGKIAPNGIMLSNLLANEFSLNTPNNYPLPKIASLVVSRKGRLELEGYLEKVFKDLSPDHILQWLFTNKWAAIITTNYDRVIERAYEMVPNPPQKPVVITISSERHRPDPKFEVPIYHVHGALYEADTNVIITDDDFIRFREERRMMHEILKNELSTSPVLYIGYGNKDPNWITVIDELTTDYYPSRIPYSYRIAPETDPIDKELLLAKGIESVDWTLEEFVSVASLNINAPSLESNRYQIIEKSVPQQLIELFKKYPAAVARLLNSWQLVNQANYSEAPNITSFLRGDRPNWSLIDKGLYFERDIQEPLYDEIVEFATSPNKKSNSVIILAPAGYGVTTLLMSLAVKSAKDELGPVYMRKPGAQVNEGDIEFIVTQSEKKPIFVINNAAEYSSVIHSMIHHLNDLKMPAIFILGERLNEWRQLHDKFTIKEYQIEQLSEEEILKLLELLEKQGELGNLELLPIELKITAIKQKHGKELLVVLREITEGKSFDAILEEEYRGINGALAKKLYLYVCCASQFGAFVRDSLLAQVLGKELTKIYEETTESTEGVVIYEEHLPEEGMYTARTRHRIIAAVVWERCALNEEKDEIITKMINAINMNYPVDRKTFEDFIRSDRLIGQIRTFEGKTKFFETACKKDPNNSYVKQHYARMLLREGKSSIALDTIEQAIRSNPSIRVLHHTKGMILMKIAIESESNEVGLRRLAQSEAAFRQGISLYKRDEYCYQGLVQLYFNWAKRATTADESMVYIQKAEGIISEGLTRLRIKDGLWIESAAIQSFLGEEPTRIKHLENAVKESPSSTIARYLLGREYRLHGRIDDCLQVLDPIIKNKIEEFRSYIEFALALAKKNKRYDESIAILNLSTLYGYSEPRFIATLGGMLFMNKQFTESGKVFSEAIAHEFSYKELNEVYFEAINFNSDTDPLFIIGRVVVIKPGFVFIESEGYPKFLCPGSKYHGIVMAVNKKIKFQPVFSSRGALVKNPIEY